MSVVFTTFSAEHISLCADKRATNLKTGEYHDGETKIQRWYPEIAVGFAGCQPLADMILPIAQNYVKEDKIPHNVEEISDAICQVIYAVKDEYPEMPKGLVVKFVVAGKLSNGKLGVGDILADDNDPDLEIYEGKDNPSTLIFAPEDMTDMECNMLFHKATVETKVKDKKDKDIVETTHHKAVRYVSEKSKYVGSTSDYIYMDYDNIK